MVKTKYFAMFVIIIEPDYKFTIFCIQTTIKIYSPKILQ